MKSYFSSLSSQNPNSPNIATNSNPNPLCIPNLPTSELEVYSVKVVESVEVDSDELTADSGLRKDIFEYPVDNREKGFGIGGNMGSIDLSGDKVDLSGQMHHLPCCIKYTGPSEVSDYFKPKNAGDEVDNLVMEEAHFRGRKLLGTTILIPGGYHGFVIGKKNIHNGKDKKISSTEVDSQSNDWEVLAKSHNISVWNHDTVPSKDDAFIRVFHWLTVASALHEPVASEDLTARRSH